MLRVFRVLVSWAKEWDGRLARQRVKQKKTGETPIPLFTASVSPTQSQPLDAEQASHNPLG
jgi:hypothetical protein